MIKIQLDYDALKFSWNKMEKKLYINLSWVFALDGCGFCGDNIPKEGIKEIFFYLSLIFIYVILFF